MGRHYINLIFIIYFQLKYEREKVSDQLSELELKHHGLQELIQTLQDGKGAAKVAEWHSKMQDTRLQHLKLSRKINRLQEQVSLITVFSNTRCALGRGEGVSMGEVGVDLAGW